MKKIAILCAAFAMASLGLTSCQKDENHSNQTFTASFEQATNGKVSLNKDLQMYWAEIGYPSVLISTFNAAGNLDQSALYSPTSISDDSLTARLEYFEYPGFPQFEDGTTGPFYAQSIVCDYGYLSLNSNGSLHIGRFSSSASCYTYGLTYIMPMVARADDFGALRFKHLGGLLKIYVTLPDGYTCDDAVTITDQSAQGGQTLNYGSCDVAWDAQGNITVSNVTNNNNLDNTLALPGNGFYYCAIPAGTYRDLKFSISTKDANNNSATFVKTMKSGASINVERAGITTLTLTCTTSDIPTK